MAHCTLWALITVISQDSEKVAEQDYLKRREFLNGRTGRRPPQWFITHA